MCEKHITVKPPDIFAFVLGPVRVKIGIMILGRGVLSQKLKKILSG